MYKVALSLKTKDILLDINRKTCRVAMYGFAGCKYLPVLCRSYLILLPEHILSPDSGIFMREPYKTKTMR